MKLCRILVLLAFALLSGCGDHHYQTIGFIEGQFRYLAPAIGGTLQKLYVDKGYVLRAGQKLLELDPFPEQAQVTQAKYQLFNAEHTLVNLIKGQRQTVLASLRAQLRQSQADLKYAQITLQRSQAEYKIQAISKQTLDQAVDSYQSALQKVKQNQANLAENELGSRVDQIKAQRAAVESARATLAQNIWALQQKTLFAPLNSRVVDRFFQPGEYIPTGQAALQILAPSDIKLVFYIPEGWLSRMKIGKRVSFQCDSCNKRTNAKVSFISPQAKYTPPVIFSRDIRYKLVYRIEAIMPANVAVNFNPGQPVEVRINL